MTTTYRQATIDSIAMNESNDCAIKAVAIVTGTPYDTIHRLFKARGRIDGTATSATMTLDVMERDLGLTISIADIRQQSGRRYTVRTIPKARPIGRHLVYVKDHVLALVDGLVMDWTRNRMHRVEHIWTIIE
jgi:hypothetical protein